MYFYFLTTVYSNQYSNLHIKTFSGGECFTVKNPEYERNRIDTRVKITNLPERCTIKIYNTQGKLVKTFKKDTPITSIDWLLINHKGIPVSSGVYLIHVDVEGVGEKIIKSFISMRQTDLQNI